MVPSMNGFIKKNIWMEKMDALNELKKITGESEYLQVIKNDDKKFYEYTNICIFIYHENCNYYRVGENVVHLQKWIGILKKKKELREKNGRYNFTEPLQQYIQDCNITAIPKSRYDIPLF